MCAERTTETRFGGVGRVGPVGRSAGGADLVSVVLWLTFGRERRSDARRREEPRPSCALGAQGMIDGVVRPGFGSAAAARRTRSLPAADVRGDGAVPGGGVQPACLPAALVLVLVADAGQPVRG